MKPGPRNLISDVAGLRVGNAANTEAKTGVTVLTSTEPFTAAVHVMGGAPGTRETDLLAPEALVDRVDALVLSGGSAYGLDAAAGVMAGLRAEGRGYEVHGQVVPIVPSAILLDFPARGDVEWRDDLWRDLGRMAYAVTSSDFEIGTRGAGTGATTANYKGGLGSASAVMDNMTVGALVAANPMGSAVVGDGPAFWAAPFELDGEFGDYGVAAAPPGWQPTKGEGRAATTIGIVATDIDLTKTQLKRLAMMAHDGIARAVVPAHTPFDGDLIFAVSTGRIPAKDADAQLVKLGHMAASCVARSIARGIHEAAHATGDPLPTWSMRWGQVTPIG